MTETAQLKSIVLKNGAKVTVNDVILVRETLEAEKLADEISAGTVAEITEIHFGNETSAGFLAVYTEDHGFFRAHGLADLMEENKVAIGEKK